MRLYRYLLCGHVGRENDSPFTEVSAFIRVAEARKRVVENVGKNCPDCGGNR